ncbi:interleukin-1 receptor-associated kinase-like 2 [Hemicordylus capensis]|uniref:interleukin-1 receptor-associated kinase-like 2 n=1 Tax=Hemicordylus capensis TaxID=884348 RepID=UPI002303D83D|nr:interleukin-1 receptor-associated kinase-like 2 [Hemicordylus capensis]
MAKEKEKADPAVHEAQQGQAMAQQQQQQHFSVPSLDSAAPQSPYIHSIPSRVLEDFCQKMDCLSDYDWMRFASYVITDQTELRKIKCMEKAGISITRELMWWWGVRLATVKQLLELLQELQLYRAAQVIVDWKPPSLTLYSVRAPLEPLQQENASLHPAGNKNKATANKKESRAPPDTLHSDPDSKATPEMLPLSPSSTSMDLPHSLQSNPSVLLSVKPCSSSIPHQETLPNVLSESLLWTRSAVEAATSGFTEENRIHEGMFADAYKGQKHNSLYVVKRLKDNETQRFFHTEVQICFRCCHQNILRLLGFSVEDGFHCLIYPYMPNGSLMDRLQCQDGSEPLSWEKRIRISIGLVQAIRHLHNLGIIHGNVKSSNVLLDASFAPQLGHSGLRLHPVERKSECAVIKTKVLQASLAYFPEDFIRHGQLTEKVDIFSCGIVLAEILTGRKAVDERRHPVFLKDALLDEIQQAKVQSGSKAITFEKRAAEEICCKYKDKQTAHFSAEPALCLATAACVCLRKKNPDMAEVYEITEMAAHHIEAHKVAEGSKYCRLFVNTPEETNDEPASPFNGGVSVYGNCESSVNAGSLNCVDLLPPLIRVAVPETYSEQMLRVPCESDESSSFLWDLAEDVSCQQQNISHPDPENISPTEPHTNNQEYTSDFTANVVSDRSTKLQETSSASDSMTSSNRENSAATCSSQAQANEAFMEIKINDKKKKLMEQCLLYEAKKLNSCELFES